MENVVEPGTATAAAVPGCRGEQFHAAYARSSAWIMMTLERKAVLGMDHGQVWLFEDEEGNWIN
jgi:hypothetical protein